MKNFIRLCILNPVAILALVMLTVVFGIVALKKIPLQMPPDMNKLPKPGDDLESESQIKNDEVSNLLKIKSNDNSEGSKNESDLLNNMKKKIQ